MELRIICGNCSSEYRVSDEKLATRSVRFKCKKCDQEITLSPGADGVEAQGGSIKSPFEKSFPSKFGKFHDLRRVAGGGMGDIYLAKLAGAEGFEREVVLKVLHPHLAKDESFARALVDEAKITVLMHHPNIVQMYNLEKTGDLLYCVMEHVPGESLANIQRTYRKKGVKIPADMAINIAMQTLDGLAYAHELKTADGKKHDIVHRDISPQNILVTVDGWVKIIDFGIAKAASRITQTMPGFIKGKFAYMAPEQLKGITDHRADIFAMGVVLWETLSGVRLFHSTTDVDTLHKVLHLDPPPISLSRSEIPENLDMILARALHKDLEQRFQSAREFKTALAGFIAPRSADDLRSSVDIDASRVEAREQADAAGGDSSFTDMTPVIDSSSLHSISQRKDIGRSGKRVWLISAVLLAVAIVAAGLIWGLPHLQNNRAADAGLAVTGPGPDAGGRQAEAVGTDGGAGPDGGARQAADSSASVADTVQVAVIKKPPDNHRPKVLPKLTRKRIERVLRSRGGRLQRCADEHLVDEKLGQSVGLKLKFSIDSGGHVTVVNLEPVKLEQTRFGRCLMKQVRALKFQRNRDKGVSISFPLAFQAVKQ
ncbi:MAG TPA: protein kinase [Myxococcota bacterium]|nr:protein kinase [Myxococcota bacterium]